MTGKDSIDLNVPISPEFLHLVGEVTLEWTKLDYVLRVACKRIEGVGLDSPRGKVIQGMQTHGEVIQAIELKLNGFLAEKGEVRSRIRAQLDIVGKKRNEKLYGRRNEINHALFWKSRDGATIRSRIGDSNSGATRVTELDMTNLVKQLREAWRSLLDLTDAFVGDNSFAEGTARAQVSAPASYGSLGYDTTERGEG